MKHIELAVDIHSTLRTITGGFLRSADISVRGLDSRHYYSQYFGVCSWKYYRLLVPHTPEASSVEVFRYLATSGRLRLWSTLS